MVAALHGSRLRRNTVRGSKCLSCVYLVNIFKCHCSHSRRLTAVYFGRTWVGLDDSLSVSSLDRFAREVRITNSEISG